MNLQQQTFNLLNKYKLAAKKSFGQNFLINEKVLDQIIEIANLQKSDNVLEIGPGLGFLTAKLCAQAGHVVALEADHDMFSLLEQETSHLPNLVLKQQDALKYNFQELSQEFANKPYAVVANLPYNITMKFLRLILEIGYQPQRMVLMLQKEVAQRITALPGKMSKIAVLVQFFCLPKLEFLVPKSDFYPIPQVDSAIVSFDQIAKTNFQVKDYEKFWQIVRVGFAAKRKKLIKNLQSVFDKNLVEQILDKAQISPDARPQELSVDDWVKLANFF